MNYKNSLVSAIFTVVLLLLANYAFTHSWGFSLSPKQPFTVQGSSTLTAEPDQAQIYFAVTKTSLTLSEAQSQANTFVNTIVTNLQALGIAKKYIKTENYNSYPNYEQPNPKMMMPVRPDIQTQTIVSYTVSENVTITIHDITNINKVIDAVTKDGAENISGPNLNFSEDKQRSLTNEARVKAITDAKQKAHDIAQAAGIHLGRIVNIQENNQGSPIPVMYDMKSGASGSGGTPTQINPGQNTITETVTLSYETW